MKHSHISERPPQIKPRFLRRKLILFPDDELILKKIRMKGLHIRYVLEIDDPQDQEDPILNLKKHKYLKGKNISGLQKIELSSFPSLHWFNNLKNAKSLRDVYVEIGTEDLEKITGFLDVHAKIKHIIQCLKKLPKNIKEIKLCIGGLSVKKKDMNQIYRALASLKNLEYCSRLFGFAQLEGYLQEDYRLIKRYIPLLPKLKEFDYDYWRYDKTSWDDDEVLNIANYTSADQVDFQKLVKNNEAFPLITTLPINIVGEFLQTFPVYGRDFEVEKSEDEEQEEQVDEEEEEEEEKKEEKEEEKKLDRKELEKTNLDAAEDDPNNIFYKFYEDNDENNEEDKAEEEKAQKVREEIMPFYQLHRFTNLKKLDFQIFPDCLYTLEPFVVEAFASLKNLEHLEVTLEARPMGTGYIFEGIAQLPLLKSFSLETIFLSNDDWKLLHEFFKKQEDLESLSFEISKKRRTRARYDAQNKQFRDLFKNLDGKSKLQYLTVCSDFCPLEALSEGLKELTMSHQFKLLHLKAMDDISTSYKNASQRVEGLCDFLNRQRGSLLYLKLSLPYVIDSGVMEHLTAAISDLEELKELELLVNNIYKGERQAYTNFFEKTMMKDNPVRTCKNKKCYYRNMAAMLGKLKKLDDLILYFGANSDNQKFGEEFIELLSVLPKMRTLKSIDMNIPFFNVSTWMLQRMKVFFDKMRDISGLIVDTEDVDDDSVCDEIEVMVEKVNQRQYLRCDLMF